LTARHPLLLRHLLQNSPSD
nr:Chain I, 19-mer peptide [synthetic construct]4J24_J Chain J, 19-mer peptide [synthetic construct]4J24_K Chain K, 19-mer peptide [synthetic construct]4J24_L Chain L, 19-mer peptide [synthetic construct]